MKVKQVEMKHGIDSKMVHTKQMVKKLNNKDPYETMTKYNMNKETEEQIEESLENLNFLLAQNNKSKNEKQTAYKKLAKKMDIRLDSTSPVREVQYDKEAKCLNPFVYKPEVNNTQEDHLPSFKPRSVINSNSDAISSISKPKSQITVNNTSNQSKVKLLNKNICNKGSYLNAESLAYINDNNHNQAQNEFESSFQSFSNYQQITDQVVNVKNKANARNCSNLRQKSRSRSKNRKINDEDEEYEDDFDDLSDNELEHKIVVNPKFNIKSLI